MEKFDPVYDARVLEELSKDNFIIEEDTKIVNNLCYIYFSSHAVYFPETKGNFKDKIVNKNVFEWYKRRISNVRKSIFVRDIRKQFYCEGINNNLNSIDKLLGFLKKETKNFDVITVGSSAGGYLAALVGGGDWCKEKLCLFWTIFLKARFCLSNKRITSPA